MPPPLISATYAAVLALIMAALLVHVIMLRAKTGISISDGGNVTLAERMRRHGNFIENVPMALLLMLMAELLGASHLWLHVFGAALVAGRVLHAIGLAHDQPKNPLRIMGASITLLVVLALVCNILAIRFAG
jgi:uncharacterized protein